MEREKSAGVVIFRKNGEIKYLILQYGLGHWSFVKGNVESGLSEQETVIKEAREEAGIPDLELVEDFKERESYFYKWEGKLISKEVTFFLATTKTESVKLSYEHKDYKWVNFEEPKNI